MGKQYEGSNTNISTRRVERGQFWGWKRCTARVLRFKVVSYERMDANGEQKLRLNTKCGDYSAHEIFSKIYGYSTRYVRCEFGNWKVN